MRIFGCVCVRACVRACISACVVSVTFGSGGRRFASVTTYIVGVEKYEHSLLSYLMATVTSPFRVVWQYQFDKANDTWQDYGAEASEIRDYAYIHEISQIAICVQRTKRRRFDETDHIELIIDFKKMVQIGEVSRPIRRTAILDEFTCSGGSAGEEEHHNEGWKTIIMKEKDATKKPEGCSDTRTS